MLINHFPGDRAIFNYAKLHQRNLRGKRGLEDCKGRKSTYLDVLLLICQVTRRIWSIPHREASLFTPLDKLKIGPTQNSLETYACYECMPSVGE